MKLKFGLMILLVICRKYMEKIIECKEREPEVEDMDTLHDPNTMEALRKHVFLKFFKTRSMRKKSLLLEHMIRMWDANEQLFLVGIVIPILCITKEMMS
jgi:hypothetical protein